MNAYTTSRLTPWTVTDDVEEFAREAAVLLEERYNGRFKAGNFDLREYVGRNLVLVCRRDGEVVGILLAQQFRSVFDNHTQILMQDLLYAKPGAIWAARLLLDQFVDFGKRNANHVFTMTTPQANIKGKSLERMGFRKIEEIYALEHVHGVGREK